jgi:hypothetical protein
MDQVVWKMLEMNTYLPTKMTSLGMSSSSENDKEFKIGVELSMMFDRQKVFLTPPLGTASRWYHKLFPPRSTQHQDAGSMCMSKRTPCAKG